MRHAVPHPGKTSPGTPNVPDFKMQPKPNMTTIIITITIMGVIVLIQYTSSSVIAERPRCRVG